MAADTRLKAKVFRGIPAGGREGGHELYRKNYYRGTQHTQHLSLALVLLEEI